MVRYRVIFFYELYDGVTGEKELTLTISELRRECEKFDNDGDVVWWDYEEV